MSRQEGLSYAPTGKPQPVVQPGEYVFAAVGLDHGHIYGQTNGLLEAGATLKWVYDADPKKIEFYRGPHPQAKVARSLEEILEDPAVHLVASASVPSERGPLGMKVLDAGKDYFTDKSPFTTLDQLAEARRKVTATGRRYMVYYSERLHVESAWYAGEMIRGDAIGKVLQIVTLAPHRLSKANRPDWFFDKSKYGGIITDIGSHQFDQFLAYADAKNGNVNFARVENFANPDKPGLEDFGEVSLTLDTGTSAYTRIDWFTPNGLSSWGDGRTFVLGSKGFIEIRKYCDIARGGHDMIYWANGEKEEVIDCRGKVGFPFFGAFILDLLHRTEKAMTQEHAFMAAELSMKAQQIADAAHPQA
jgi:predicted dehydrogenase